MGAALASHGPDGCGVWTNDRAGMGQRLMCFTPEDRLERQPVASAGNRCVLVADGRIDNRRELTEKLGITPRAAREMPDSAFLARAWERWGSNCVDHLAGDFVFAVFDTQQDCLLIFRSPLSQRSLYYHYAAGRFAFSSAPKGLFALPGVPREIDRQSLADYLTSLRLESGRSLFAGLHRLPSGHMLVARRSGVQANCTWRPDLRPEIRFSRDSEYLEAFLELFERVIADSLRSLTPVTVMMSGGLDSSSIAAVAAGILGREGKRLSVFTEVPPPGSDPTVPKGRYANEAPLVNAIARKCGNIDVNFVCGRCFFLDGIDRFFAAAEYPFQTTWNRVWWEAILREASGQGARVVLTGVPGNLTFSWDGQGLLPQLIRRGRWVKAVREASQWSRLNPPNSTLMALARGFLPLLPEPVWKGVRRLWHSRNGRNGAGPDWRTYSPIHPQFAQAQRVEERARERNLLPGYQRAGRNTRQERYRLLQMREAEPDISRGHEAMFRVQRRDPGAASRLVEFCLSLPEEQFRQDGVSRSLIRRAMAGCLPDEVTTNRQRGLQSANWFDRTVEARSRIREEIARIAGSELARLTLDWGRVGVLLDRMPDSSSAAWGELIRYRQFLGTALMTGSFLYWFESSARTPEPL